MKIEDLSPEVLEKAKACETPEELLALAKQEGIELSEEELEALSGGVSLIPCVGKVQPGWGSNNEKAIFV